jgi:ribosomal protein S18 acetylase RimI-like enzyme
MHTEGMGDPTVTLRPMRADEFDAYMEGRDRHYTASLSSTMSPAAAEAKAAADRRRLLPQGYATEGHRFLCVETETGVVVGSVWLGLSDPRTGSRDSAFLYDIEVARSHRRKGYAKAILRAVERLAGESGAQALSLNVFGNNQPAIALYNSCGYRVASQQMIKGV